MNQTPKFNSTHSYRVIIALLLVGALSLIYALVYNKHVYEQQNNSYQMKLKEMTMKNNKLIEENIFLVNQVESLSAVQHKVQENQQIIRNFKPKEVVHVVQSNEEIPFFVRNPDLLDDAIRLHNQYTPEG